MRKNTAMISLQTVITYIPIIAAMILIIVLITSIIRANTG